MKKVLLVLIGIIGFVSESFAASNHHLYELPNGQIRFEVTYTEPKSYVEVFIKKNEKQITAKDITESFRANGDGTFSYHLLQSNYVGGDLVAARFYSHSDGIQEFTPEPFSPGFVSWGKSLIYTNPIGGSSYVTELPTGKILFTVKMPYGQDYVEIFVRKNGTQIIAQEITYNYDADLGAYYLLDDNYAEGDDVEVRFYSHRNGIRKFIPGSAEQVWSTHSYGAYANPTLATNDSTYTLGSHVNDSGNQVHTQVFFDMGFDYLTPIPSSEPATSWIVDLALAQSFKRNFYSNTVEFKGMYVRTCNSGEWVNINNTIYAPLEPPFTLGTSTFGLNHYYSNSVNNILLDTDFSCPGSPVKTARVSVDGVTQSVLSIGRVHFAYVIEHQ